jgi:nucleotide-binding universal stress UspA family protein
MFDRILLAVDGSDHSNRALARVIELAGESDGEVRVVNVHEIHWVARAVPTSRDEDTPEATGLVADTLKQLEGAGVKASGAVRQSLSGRIAAEVCEEAADWAASVIVLGTRGHTDLESVLLGSVCHRVLHLARVPVLVVP